MPDYRDHRHPKMWSWEILARLKEGKIREFTSLQVALLCHITTTEACVRLNTLKRYQLVRKLDVTVRPAVWEITPWGDLYIQKKRFSRPLRWTK